MEEGRRERCVRRRGENKERVGGGGKGKRGGRLRGGEGTYTPLMHEHLLALTRTLYHLHVLTHSLTRTCSAVLTRTRTYTHPYLHIHVLPFTRTYMHTYTYLHLRFGRSQSASAENPSARTFRFIEVRTYVNLVFIIIIIIIIITEV